MILQIRARNYLTILLGVVAATLLVCLVYWSGLGGAFLLDDFPNLAIIDQLPEDATSSDFIYLARSGIAGILGRPISMLSYLLQYSAWPDPYYFKLFNLLIHIINGGLVALCCLMIGKCWDFSPIKPVIVFIIALVWMLHPIQVSTVLYVVQRMTMLSSVFILLGIIGYLFGRYQVSKARLRSGSIFMIASPLLGALLGILSKENGALIYPYLLVIEFTLLANTELSMRMRQLRRWSLLIPLALGTIAFILYLPSTMSGYEIKPFNLLQRILTEPQVLLNYVLHIGLPLPGNFGIYHDDFRVYQGSVDLLWAGSGILLVFAALTAAVIYRKRWSLPAFAVLWFLVGHALESTILPLEIYFEHRNYLPLFGPVFAFTVLASNYLSVTRRAFAPAKVLAPLLLVSACALVTRNEAILWGDPLAQAYDAVAIHPQSRRANGVLVRTLSSEGEVVAAFEHHREYTLASGAGIANYIRWLEFSCLLSDITLPDDETLRQQAKESAHDYSSIFSLNSLSAGIINGSCSGLSVDKVLLVLESLQQNQAYAVSQPDLLQLEALLRANRAEFEAAIELAKQSYDIRPDVRTALYKTAWLLQKNDVAAATAELEAISLAHASALQSSSSLAAQYANLRAQVNAQSN